MSDNPKVEPTSEFSDELLDEALARAFGEVTPELNEPENKEVDDTLITDRVPGKLAEQTQDMEYHFDGYKVVRELGRGGMGVVFLAEQIQLKRMVAVKMILSRIHANREVRRRFQIEAESIARLHHPHIVQIHEIGEQDGYPFFSLEYVEGGSLANRLDGTPWPPKQAVELIELLARAIHEAHRKEIIHRDLKPANILMTTSNTPKITDFGLAKIIDHEQGNTESGDVLGTPSYMAPESASGKNKRIHSAVDVYSLGAIFYELLTGRPPFKAETPVDTILHVLSLEPIAPSKLQPNLPRDAETICLKCLEKDPAKRYDSALSLANDLRNYLDGKPITARPVGNAERLLRWCRRNPRLAGLSAALSVLLFALVLGVFVFALYVNRANTDLQRANKKATENETAAKTNARKAKLLAVTSQDNATRAENNAEETRRTLEHLYVSNGVRLADQGNQLEALLWFARPLKEQHGKMISEDMHRRRLATYLRYGRIPTLLHLFSQSVQTARRMQNAKFSPDGKVMFSYFPQEGFFSDRVSGQPLFRRYITNTSDPRIYFSPNSRYIVTTNARQSHVWDWRMRKHLCACKGFCLSFSPDSGKLVTLTRNITGDTVHVWDVLTGKEEATFEGFPSLVKRVLFTPDGPTVLTITPDHEVQLWQADPRKQIGKAFVCPCEKILDVGPNNRLILSQTGTTAQVWDRQTGKQTAALQHDDPVLLGAFSRDGKWLATTTADGVVRLWDPQTGQPITPMILDQKVKSAGAMMFDNQEFLTHNMSGVVKAWRVGEPLNQSRGIKPEQMTFALTFSPKGNVLGPDGKGNIVVFDPIRTKRVSQFVGFGGRLFCNGSYVVGYDDKFAVGVWNLSTGKAIGQAFKLKSDGFHHVSPDGRLVATSGFDKETVILRNSATGEPDGKPLRHSIPIRNVTFDPGGRIIATGSFQPPQVQLWDVATRKPMGNPISIPKSDAQIGKAPKVTFSPDGRTFFIYGTADRSIRVYDVATRKPIGPLIKHRHKRANGYVIRKAAFSRDSKMFATSGFRDPDVYVWETATGRALSPPLPHSTKVEDVAFSSDGRHVMTLSAGVVRFWDISPDPRPAADLLLLTELLHGHRLDPQGVLVPLSVAELQSGLRNLKRKYGTGYVQPPGK